MKYKDAQIIAQTAGKIAADLVIGTQAGLEQYPVYLKSVVDSILGAIEEIPYEPDYSPAPAQPVAPATAPAPFGAPQAPNVYAQAAQNLQAAGLAPTPVTPQTEEDWWLHLVNNRDDWWNNTGQGDTTIAGGTRPDFRAKTLVDAKGQPKALFLVSSKYNKTAPDFVFQAFGLAKPGPVAVQAPTAAAPQAAPF